MKSSHRVALFAGLLSAFLVPHSARAQLTATSQVRIVTADAYARDTEVTSSPPQNSATAPNFGVFSNTVVNSTLASSANANSDASQLSQITAYFISATGHVSASATVVASENASAGGQSVADISFAITNQQAYSMQGSLTGSATSAGSNSVQIVLRALAGGTNLFVRNLPADAGAFAVSGALSAGSYEFFVTSSSTATVNTVSGPLTGSCSADYGAFLRIAPAPRLTQIARATNATTAAWQSVSGTAYQVQFAASPLAAAWTNLGPTVSASNAAATASDTNAPAAARVYRVYPLP